MIIYKEDSSHVTYQCREYYCWNPKAQRQQIENCTDEGGNYGENEEVMGSFVGGYGGSCSNGCWKPISRTTNWCSLSVKQCEIMIVTVMKLVKGKYTEKLGIGLARRP